ncbi:MAG: GNAT family N-acetyltransferase [Chitinophagaceae bacterium]|nr:GNAT family N-acetyltransferase [Chitinophagaceae bacterium]
MLKIRNASIKDIPLIQELTYQVWPQTYAPILSNEQIEYMLEMMYSDTSLRQQMGDGARFLIAYEDKVPVGFAAFQEIKPTLFKLHKIYVLGTRQGKGTGRFMINHIIEEIRKQGASTLQLQVNRHNKAKDFYELLGFTIIEEADFDIGNGYFMNDYVMEKKIN